MSGTADFEKWASEKGIVLARHEDGEYLWGPARDAWAAWKYLSESTTLPAHRDDAAVDALAELMKAKLAKQRAKGYGGWDTDCTRERLSELLRGHVDKGDPVDVANFCAFLSSRGEGIAPETSTPTVAQLQARVAELEAALREGTDTLRSLGNMPDYLVHDDAWDKEQVARKIVAYTQLLGS